MWNGTNVAAKKRLRRQPTARRCFLEQLESREVFSATPLPVLMVVANQDFYYQEYGDTRTALEASGVPVAVAAARLEPAIPHANTGQGNSSGIVQPNVSLSEADAADYSAIVFVGGWGSSSYQYAFEGTYSNAAYNGDSVTKQHTNDLIADFVEQDKPVAAICHGVTVLAWARVDGVSPLDGKQVSVPWIGSPAVAYENRWYGNYELQQYPQVLANGASANTTSGQYGDPTTVADDVVVDGRIITAENYDSATHFGNVIAQEVQNLDTVRLNGPDILVAGTAGDDNIAIRSLTSGQIVVTVNGVNQGRFSPGPGGHVKVFAGSGNDIVTASQSAAAVELYGGPGTDTLSGGKASDLIEGGRGNDTKLVGGPGRDLVFGGDGNDYLAGGNDDDILVGGDGNDHVVGGSGDDLLIGGEGTDRVLGGSGEDVLIGGSTSYDTNIAPLRSLRAGWTGLVDADDAYALQGWVIEGSDTSTSQRLARIQAGSSSGIRLREGETVFDDFAADELNGGTDSDARFAAALDILIGKGDITV